MVSRHGRDPTDCLPLLTECRSSTSRGSISPSPRRQPLVQPAPPRRHPRRRPRRRPRASPRARPRASRSSPMPSCVSRRDRGMPLWDATAPASRVSSARPRIFLQVHQHGKKKKTREMLTHEARPYSVAEGHCREVDPWNPRGHQDIPPAADQAHGRRSGTQGRRQQGQIWTDGPTRGRRPSNGQECC